MSRRFLIVLALLFVALALTLPTPQPKPQLVAGPSFGQPALEFYNPVNNPMIAGESIRKFYDPTGNEMGGHGARPNHGIGDLAPAMSDASLYQDTLGMVSLHNGCVLHTEPVHHVPSVGFDFNLMFTYSSKEAYLGLPHQGLGLGWTHNFGANVQYISGIDRYVLYNGFGGRVHFVASSTSNYYVPVGGGYDGSYSTLLYNANGAGAQDDTITIRNRFGMVTTFAHGNPYTINANIYMVSEIRDPNDNVMTVSRIASSFNVYQVFDTYGRAYTFTYTGGGLLDYVTDFDGRVIDVSVNAGTGQLDSIGLVEVTGTSTGNNFSAAGSNRKTIQFDYYGSMDDPPYLMESITRPNEVANSDGPKFTFEYYAVATDTPAFVETVKVGTDNYHHAPGGALPEVNYAWSGNQATVVDREGNSTVYNFNSTGHCTSVVEPTETGTATTSFLYTTTREVTKVTYPRGNYINLNYDTAPVTDFMYNQGNLLQTIFNRGAIASDQNTLVTDFTYENLYNNLLTVDDPKGYTTNYTTDYFEETTGATLTAFAVAEFMNLFSSGDVATILTGVPSALGDINGDSTLAQKAGRVIAKRYEDVTLMQIQDPAQSPGNYLPTQHDLEGDTTQEAGESWTYNSYGQVTSAVDCEENASFFNYFTYASPDTGSLGDGGYLALTVEDGSYSGGYAGSLSARDNTFFGDIGRDSALDPTENEIYTDYAYNGVGVVVMITDGRGIQTTFEVNQLDQVVLITRNSGVDMDVDTRGGGFTDHVMDVNENETDLSDTPLAYVTEIYYDFNNNVVARLVENSFSAPGGTSLTDTPDFAMADTGLPGSMSISGAVGMIETYYYRDILDNLRRVETEIDDTGSASVAAVTEYEYDDNENRTFLQYPESVAGSAGMTNNSESWTWTKRDLMKTHTRAPGSGDASTVGWEYDDNRNNTVFTDAEDNDGTAGNEEIVTTFDGHDRPKTRTNAVNTVTTATYDANSNVTHEVVNGYILGALAGSPEDLRIAHNTYNERNQLIQKQEELFVTSVGGYLEYPSLVALDDSDGPGAGSTSTTVGDDVDTFIDHDRLGRNTFTIQEDRDVDISKFDGCSRLIEKVDTGCGCGNKKQLFYDDNGNLVRTLETDKPTDDVAFSGLADGEYLFITDYDALNRPIVQINYANDSAFENLTTYNLFDSRGLLRATADAQNNTPTMYTTTNGDPFSVNEPGNVSQLIYDAGGRQRESLRYMTSSGLGDGTWEPTSTSVISNTQDWDLNSRPTVKTDDNGNPTENIYDELNRHVGTDFADGNSESMVFDADDNLIQRTDQNNSVFAMGIDGVNRRVSVTVSTFGSGVANLSKYLEFEFDGLNRLYLARDSKDTALDSNDIVFQRRYNSRSQVMEEQQDFAALLINAKAICCNYVDESDRGELRYPNEIGQTNVAPLVTYGHDDRDRIDAIDFTGSSIGGSCSFSFAFFGARDLQRVNSNGVTLNYFDGSTGLYYDPFRRPTRIEHIFSSTPIHGVDTAWDRMNNRLTEDRTDWAPLFSGSSPGILHSWDPGTTPYDSAYRVRGELITLSGIFTLQDNTFVHDGVHNRLEGTAMSGIYNNFGAQTPTLDGSAGTSMNMYDDLNGSIFRSHDDNGNLTDDGTNTYDYDAFNRLRGATRNSDSMAIGEYHFDALGRRVERIVTNTAYNTHIIYYYDRNEVIEEYGPDEEEEEAFAPEKLSDQEIKKREELAKLLGATWHDGPTIELIQKEIAAKLGPEAVSPAALLGGSVPGVLLRRYIWRTSPIDNLLAMEEFGGTNARLYAHEDSLGNVRAMTLQDGSTLFGYDYDTFGQIGVWTFISSTSGGPPPINPYLFNTRRLDPETGLYYYRARMMDPITGRFIQRDSIGIWGDGGNLGNGYSYVANNPINHLDPYGMSEEEEIPDAAQGTYYEKDGTTTRLADENNNKTSAYEKTSNAFFDFVDGPQAAKVSRTATGERESIKPPALKCNVHYVFWYTYSTATKMNDDVLKAKGDGLHFAHVYARSKCPNECPYLQTSDEQIYYSVLATESEFDYGFRGCCRKYAWMDVELAPVLKHPINQWDYVEFK